MKTGFLNKRSICGVIFLILINYSCDTWRYIYIQNERDKDVEIYAERLYNSTDVDSIKKIEIGNLENKTTFYYRGLLRADSIQYLGLFPGREKSKNVFIDTALYNRHPFNFDFLTPLVIISGTDTTLYEPKEIIENLNESWADKHSDPSQKVKGTERIKVVWKYK